MRATKNASTAALVGIWMILLTAFVVTILYVGRQLLIPLALAAMLTFLLAPLVGYIERWIGRIAAVLIVVAMLFSVVGGAGWLLTRQLIDLAAKLPDYQTNIDNKLHAIRLPTGGAFGRFSHSVSELQKQSPDSLEPPANATGSMPETKATTAARSRNVPAGQQPMPVRIVESQSRLPQILQTTATGLLGPLGTAGLVSLLVIFMLLKREDLRGRMIRLIGQGRISATTRAMDDAGSRVARYLTMLLLVNVGFGLCIAIGLYFIGVPNAALWGAFAAIMRFVPYVGVWIAAAVPVLLSFAVSTSWLSPLLTLGLFVVLELINCKCARAVALRIQHRRLVHRADHRGGFLDVALGTNRSRPRDPADCVPCRDGPARAETAILERAPQRRASTRSARGMLSPAARVRFG